jgi:hypothetical protein
VEHDPTPFKEDALPTDHGVGSRHTKIDPVAVKKRDDIPTEKGVRALLSDAVPGTERLTPEEEEFCRKSLLQGTVDTTTGVHTITYTFDSIPAAWYMGKRAASLEKLDANERELAREYIRDIESKLKGTKIKFVEALPGQARKANIPILKGDVLLEGADAFNLGEREYRPIVLDKRQICQSKENFKHLLEHECGHALGFSHPEANGKGGKAGGDNPNFDTDHTIMSYNSGEIRNPGWGRYEIAAARRYYGTFPEDPDRLVTIDELVSARALVAGERSTLDLRNAPGYTGHLEVSDDRISGYLKTPEGTGDPVKARFLEKTKFRDVLGAGSDVKLWLTGNTLPNHLEGGNGNDTLSARYGRDTLTGNGGKDIFTLSASSGFLNIITDYTSNVDHLSFIDASGPRQTPICKANLYYCDDYPVGEKPSKGTELVVFDQNGGRLASAFLVNVTPAELAVEIERNLTPYDISRDAPPEHGLPNLPNDGNKTRGK